MNNPLLTQGKHGIVILVVKQLNIDIFPELCPMVKIKSIYPMDRSDLQNQREKK